MLPSIMWVLPVIHMAVMTVMFVYQLTSSTSTMIGSRKRGATFSRRRWKAMLTVTIVSIVSLAIITVIIISYAVIDISIIRDVRVK